MEYVPQAPLWFQPTFVLYIRPYMKQKLRYNGACKVNFEQFSFGFEKQLKYDGTERVRI